MIQQLGTPEEIYNRPANLFVASFIGAPPMNLIHGRLDDGVFSAPGGVSLSLQDRTRATLDKAVLGIRPEDMTVTDPESAAIAGPLYNAEMTGDAVFVTVEAGGSRICARGDRHLRFEGKPQVGLQLDRDFIHLFDGDSGLRL